MRHTYAAHLHATHLHSMPSLPFRAYNPGHSPFNASCLTKWRQNWCSVCGIPFRRLHFSLERARPTQRQLRPMWRRFGLPALNMHHGKPVVHGPPRSCVLPVGRFMPVVADMLAWLFLWACITIDSLFNSPCGSMHLPAAFIYKYLTHARFFLRLRQRGPEWKWNLKERAKSFSISLTSKNRRISRQLAVLSQCFCHEAWITKKNPCNRNRTLLSIKSSCF